MILSNREMAAIIWLSILVIWNLKSSKVKPSVLQVLTPLFVWRIIFLLIASILFSSGIIWLLYEVGLWDRSLLKDSIFWFFGTAFVFLMNISNESKKDRFARNALIDNLKMVLILEFIIGFQVFSLATELIILPVLVFLVMIKSYSELKPELSIVARLADYILVIAVIVFLYFSVKQIVLDIAAFASFSILKSFLMPILLTIAFLPWLYLVAVYMEYELLFVRIGIMLRDNEWKGYAKRRVIKKGKISLRRIRLIAQRIGELYNGSGKGQVKDVIDIPR